MNNIKELFKNTIKRIKVVVFFKKVAWQERLIHFYSKYRSFIFVAVGLIIFSIGLYFILNRNIVRTPGRTYSTNEIEEFMNLQSELYYDPVNYFVYNEDIQLVDIRRKENFQKEHISSSINIPVEIDKANPSEIVNKEELIEAFKKLDSEKTIVIFGENTNSLVPSKLAGLLAEKHIAVKVMTIGWNEFRHLHTFWLPEQLWGKVNVLEFVESNEPDSL